MPTYEPSKRFGLSLEEAITEYREVNKVIEQGDWRAGYLQRLNDRLNYLKTTIVNYVVEQSVTK